MIFRSLALLALALTIPAATTLQDNASWMRYPAISPDGTTIVFTYRSDLWRVSTDGGAATQLTQHPAHDFMPVWSNDGKQIAFASDRYGNFDIYVIPATGGEAQRITYHSAQEYPYSFTPDNKSVVFGAARMDAAGNRQYPIASMPELWSVPVTSGRPVQLLTTPADDARYNRNGSLLIYTDNKGRENVWRKHHTSSVARDIWVYDVNSGAHRQVTTFAGEDRQPVFADGENTFYYLSEESGTMNVHRMPLTGGASQQLTSFKGLPVRFLSSANNGTLAFGHDGQLYTMKPGAAPQRVAVSIATDTKANAQQLLSVTGGARELAVSPSGKEVAFVFRGDVFVASTEGGVTKRITNTPAVETGVRFSPDGKALVYASERDSKWAIYEARRARDSEPYFYASTIVRETPLISNEHQNYQPLFSPDGKELAFIEDRTNLRVLTLADKKVRTLLDDRYIFSNNPGVHFVWSPDGKWMLFNLSVPGLAPGEVGLVPTDGNGAVINLTESGFDDRGARWIMDGKAMLWFSDRDGLKSVAQSGSAQRDAYAMFFTKDAWDRFRLTKEELALVKEQEDKAKPKAGANGAKPDTTAKTETLTFDFDGIDTRRARLTIHSSSLGDALISKDGETLYYLARFERGLNLWSTNLRTKETKQVLALNANSGSMTWDNDQKSIFMLADGAISKIDAAAGRREAVPLRGEMTLDTNAEREAMFDHVWRKVRDTFYSKGYHGVDWAAIRPVYAKYLPHIGNSYEFSEMLAEMLGELNISHSGSTYSPSSPNGDVTASLGVFLDQSYRGAGAKVEEVIQDGPLDKAGFNVKAGMIIEAIDGEEITPTSDIAQFLNRKAGKNVLLALADGATKSEIVVKPVSPADENRLLYARWVRRNAAEVDRLSNGQLGYVHIPGMNDGAMRTTVEDVMGKYATRKGIVVDTRFNGGGDLVADLAMFLSGKKFFDYTSDTRATGYEPNFRWSKPSVALANEANYSDGHCFAYAYKEQKLGPLVGMPVPGTCTFAGWESLEGGIRWGVPGVGVKDANTGKYLENMQTEPDIRVMNEYSVVNRGKDQQLEAAVSALMALIR